MRSTAPPTAIDAPSTVTSRPTDPPAIGEGGSDDVSSTPSASASVVATPRASDAGPSNLIR